MNFLKRIRNYHFEVYHFIILIVIVIVSQVLLSYLNISSTENLLSETMEIYKLETAERQSDFITSSIELFIQNDVEKTEKDNKVQTIESIDYLIYQQLLQKNVEDFCVIFYTNSKIYILDDGNEIYNYFVNNNDVANQTEGKRKQVISYFAKAIDGIYNDEDIISFVEDNNTFHVFVPFSIRGEVVGAVYQRITPDVENMASIISSSFSYTGAWISGIILLGLLMVFILTNYVVTERDNAQTELFEQKEKQLTQLIEARKEASFARRIYHAHHKAEKVVGFIKSDLLNIRSENLKEISEKVKRYTNFIGRVIYDMKTYNPPLKVIRNPQFKTNVSEVITFLINNVVKRSYINDDSINIVCNFSDEFPILNINEYVVWEIIEPLIQNSIIHNRDLEVTINIETKVIDNNRYIEISDNGKGFAQFLLYADEQNIKKIFKEKISTKKEDINSGYGCYIAYENCKRCGWEIDAINTNDGAKFIIKV